MRIFLIMKEEFKLSLKFSVLHNFQKAKKKIKISKFQDKWWHKILDVILVFCLLKITIIIKNIMKR